MKYHNITKDDMLNGPGLRVVLWVAGCEHACEGCQNPCTWNPDEGLEFDFDAKMELFEQLGQDYIDGITFSGGDPLHSANRNEIAALVTEIKNRYPDKTIIIYTGYQIVNDNNIFYLKNQKTGKLTQSKFPFRLIDVVIDGRFEQETRKQDIAEHKVVHWRGSSNQRIIDVQQSIKNKNITEFKEEVVWVQ